MYKSVLAGFLATEVKMKRLFWVLFILLACLLFVSTTEVQASQYYRLQVGTDEWEAQTNTQDKVKQLQLNEIKTALSTDELLTAVLEYPYLSDLYLANSLSSVIDQFALTFDGIKELIGRADLAETIFDRYMLLRLDEDRSESLLEQTFIEVLFAYQNLYEDLSEDQQVELFKQLEIVEASDRAFNRYFYEAQLPIGKQAAQSQSRTMSEESIGFEEKASSELVYLRDFDSEFMVSHDGDYAEINTRLISDLGDAILCDILLNDEPIAYSIRVDGVLVEYADSPSPFSRFAELPYVQTIGYNLGEYYIEHLDGRIFLHQNGNVDLETTTLFNSVITPMALGGNVTIPGVTPQLQGQKNCIAAALSNAIWYWSKNGYPNLNPGSWQILLNSIQVRFENNGGFANNIVPIIADGYARSRNTSYRIGGYVHWNPSISQVKLEINAGRPCLVGFKKGSVYSDSAGHMTMCYGYLESGSYFYLRLADGWQSNQVVRLWTAYNDCVITIRPSIYSEGGEISSIGGAGNE